MKVIVISRNSFNVTEYNNASKIELSGNSYTITVSGTAFVYAAADYIVRIIGG